MIETLSHPAQSAEFLSRLHDGELPPAEAAAVSDNALLAKGPFGITWPTGPDRSGR